MTVGGVAVGCAIVVGAVFVFAGVAKLSDWKSWLEDGQSLKVPTGVMRFMPFYETSLGLLLIIGWARPVFALIAAATFGAMTILLARRLMDDEPPRCACFGKWSRKPISVSDVARNLALITLAVVAAVG